MMAEPVTSLFMTRFGLRSAAKMPSMIGDFRKLSRHLDTVTVPGLVDWTFLLESPSSCITLSLWSGPPGLSGHVDEHLEMARGAFSRLGLDDGAPKLCSTAWRLDSVSRNSYWPGVEFAPGEGRLDVGF